MRQSFTPPLCISEYNAPPPEKLPHLPQPNRWEIEETLAQEKAAYKDKYGTLPPTTLDIVPPVFG